MDSGSVLFRADRRGTGAEVKPHRLLRRGYAGWDSEKTLQEVGEDSVGAEKNYAESPKRLCREQDSVVFGPCRGPLASAGMEIAFKFFILHHLPGRRLIFKY